jgi:hypothetical protein
MGALVSARASNGQREAGMTRQGSRVHSTQRSSPQRRRLSGARRMPVAVDSSAAAGGPRSKAGAAHQPVPFYREDILLRPLVRRRPRVLDDLWRWNEQGFKSLFFCKFRPDSVGTCPACAGPSRRRVKQGAWSCKRTTPAPARDAAQCQRRARGGARAGWRRAAPSSRAVAWRAASALRHCGPPESPAWRQTHPAQRSSACTQPAPLSHRIAPQSAARHHPPKQTDIKRPHRGALFAIQPHHITSAAQLRIARQPQSAAAASAAR